MVIHTGQTYEPAHESAPVTTSAGMSNPWPTRHQGNRDDERYSATIAHEAPLLDELVRLSHGDTGWILLIAPPGLPVAKQLQAQGSIPPEYWWCIAPRSKLAAYAGTESGQRRCAAVLTWLPEQVMLDRAKLSKLGQRCGVLTRFFEPATSSPVHSGSLVYGGQDVYLNH